jgi:hypothetical protein
MRGECLLKNTDHEHFNTFSIDENVSGHDSLKIKQYPNHDSLKLKFAIFENFTNHGESIRDIPQSQIMKKNDEREIRNACVAVKRGLRVRRNCNVCLTLSPLFTATHAFLISLSSFFFMICDWGMSLIDSP